MATFRCGKCGCDEDTALCNYWSDRVRDKLPVCSACDPRIAKWHGQFPRLFGVFLVTPKPKRSPTREAFPSLVKSLADEGDQQAPRKVGAPRSASYFDDPIPRYTPLVASE
jgi:hypothetical protein